MTFRDLGISWLFAQEHCHAGKYLGPLDFVMLQNAKASYNLLSCYTCANGWGRPTYGYDGQVSRNFVVFLAIKHLPAPANALKDTYVNWTKK